MDSALWQRRVSACSVKRHGHLDIALGINRDSDNKALEEAFRKVVRKAHLDKGGCTQTAQESQAARDAWLACAEHDRGPGRPRGGSDLLPFLSQLFMLSPDSPELLYIDSEDLATGQAESRRRRCPWWTVGGRPEPRQRRRRRRRHWPRRRCPRESRLSSSSLRLEVTPLRQSWSTCVPGPWPATRAVAHRHPCGRQQEEAIRVELPRGPLHPKSPDREDGDRTDAASFQLSLALLGVPFTVRPIELGTAALAPRGPVTLQSGPGRMSQNGSGSLPPWLCERILGRHGI